MKPSPLSARAEGALLPLFVAVAGVVAWSGLVRATGTRLFPSPYEVLAGLGQLASSGKLVRYSLDSLGRVATGYALALAVGAPLGLWMGRSPVVGAALNPLVQLMRPISPIAWIPLSILIFGVGNTATYFLVFLGCFFPIVLATANAVRSVTPIYVAAARNFGLSGPRLFLHVILPAALPEIFAGLRVALGIGWLVLVASEMVALDSGLGYLVIEARNSGKRYDLVVGGMLTIGALGLFLDTLLRQVERTKWIRWARRRG